MSSFKKALLILPKYFGYESEINQQFMRLGYKTDIVFENIEELYYKYRFISRHVPSRRTSEFDRYYFNQNIGTNYDVVLTIRGSSLFESAIKEIKKNSPNARWYMYQWDSVKNNTNAVKTAEYFDKVSTFDKSDAEKYGWNYRPLFFIKESARDRNRNYDIAYICSLHSQRQKIYKELKMLNDLNCFMYMYSKQSHYIKQKYLRRNREFIGLNDSDVQFSPLGLYDSNAVMGNSNIILDYTHPNQTGFTMRTIESIGHRCKLVTNNKLALKSDFYRPANVYVYDENNFSISERFLKDEYEVLPEEIYARYSIQQWLMEILDLC